MKFEYNPLKSEINRDKHGIGLEEAKHLWVVPSVEIEAQSRFDEHRWMVIGKLDGKFYSCIFTLRGEQIRLISARRSRKKEVRIYHAIFQKKEN